MTMPATKEENAGMWQAIAHVGTYEDGSPMYAGIEHKGRMEWRKRTAEKHAREYKADHMRDAWVEPVD